MTMRSDHIIVRGYKSDLSLSHLYPETSGRVPEVREVAGAGERGDSFSGYIPMDEVSIKREGTRVEIRWGHNNSTIHQHHCIVIVLICQVPC